MGEELPDGHLVFRAALEPGQEVPDSLGDVELLLVHEDHG